MHPNDETSDEEKGDEFFDKLSGAAENAGFHGVDIGDGSGDEVA